MRKKMTLVLLLAIGAAVFCISFSSAPTSTSYHSSYYQNINELKRQQELLLEAIAKADLGLESDKKKIAAQLQSCRNQMKQTDFWLRYLEPVSYKKINGPLPVEWETEVFEKFEKPYYREGAGLTLAAQYLEEDHVQKDTLLQLIRTSAAVMEVYTADSVTRHLNSYHHFYLCNRLFLLNLAAIYTTGFECPDTGMIVPELRTMLQGVSGIYKSFDESFPEQALTDTYKDLFARMRSFVQQQSEQYTAFDHFTFIRDYVSPLYKLNQEMINRYKVSTKSMVDYTLTKNETLLFDKSLYNGSGPKGVFLRVKDTAVLAAIDRVGKLLFYDPILSGNNQRSCASCHKPDEYFTDYSCSTAEQFDHRGNLPRNTPSLINTPFNHLIMLDGKHITLQHQARGVITSPDEMGSMEAEVLKKVLSCKEYKKAFSELVQYTPQEPEISMEHIISALTIYYSKFSNYYSPFDEAMNGRAAADAPVVRGFNIFMSKAQCGTCHFVPQFNGVKPPYVGSEFEVLGVPQDTAYRALSPDKGRYGVNPAKETLHAFRTGTVRNAAHTAPYMHNGVFRTLDQVIDFYDAGGGAGKGLPVDNQTLSSDALHLDAEEKKALMAFIRSLDEKIIFDTPPTHLPRSANKKLNSRKVGGIY